jgi:hypothetical protein
MTDNQKRLINKAIKLLYEARKESSAIDNLYGELIHYETELEYLVENE